MALLFQLLCQPAVTSTKSVITAVSISLAAFSEHVKTKQVKNGKSLLENYLSILKTKKNTLNVPKFDVLKLYKPMIMTLTPRILFVICMGVSLALLVLIGNVNKLQIRYNRITCLQVADHLS